MNNDNRLMQLMSDVAAVRDEVAQQEKRGQVFNATRSRLRQAEQRFGAYAFDLLLEEFRKRAEGEAS